MDLALFDLDNTLLNGDSDHGWGIFLANNGIVDAQQQQRAQDEFYRQYVAGELDIFEFCRFQFTILKEHSPEQLASWHKAFMLTVIEPMIKTGKPELLDYHRERGDKLVIITATNDFVTAPIAQRLGVESLIATQAEKINGRYTGEVAGIPSYKEGKVERLKLWLQENPIDYQKSFFYSDSYNDLPLLELVDVPIAVTPDERLRTHAQQLHWQVID